MGRRTRSTVLAAIAGPPAPDVKSVPARKPGRVHGATEGAHGISRPHTALLATEHGRTPTHDALRASDGTAGPAHELTTRSSIHTRNGMAVPIVIVGMTQD